jgi:glycosyltransferase involved in cell wall biosynthesis
LKKNKHICIISPSLKSGGIERALTLVAEGFASKGYEVTFMSCLKTTHFFNLSPKIKLQEPNFSRKKGIINKVTTYLNLLWWIRKKVTESKPDVVLVYGDYFAPMVLLALLGVHVPKYISDRMDPNLKFPWSIRLAKKILYPTATGMIAQTEKSAKINRNRYGNKLKIVVIPNAVRTFYFDKYSKKKQILSLSRLHPEKGLDMAIEAFAKVNVPEWKWLVAGAGNQNEMKNYQEKIKSLGLEKRFVLLGEVKNIEKLLEESEIFVLPSKNEGFPNALCEAMASGLICITFEHLNDPNIITKNNWDGIVLKKYDSGELASAIEKTLLNLNDIRFMTENAQLIKERLNQKNIVNMMENFIVHS